LPSVASDTSAPHPQRLSVHSQHRSSDSSAKDRSTPFAELLDSAAPPAESRPSRDQRAERGDRADSKPQARSADRAAPSRDTQTPADDRDVQEAANGDAPDTAGEGARTSSDGKTPAVALKDGELPEAETAASADGDAPPASDAAAPEGVPAGAAPALPQQPPVTAPQPVAQSIDPAPEAPAADDQALAALQAVAAEPVAKPASDKSDTTKPDTAKPETTKPVLAQPEPEISAEADAGTEPDATPKASAADLKAAVPPVESGKDRSPREDSEAAPRDVRHAAAETLKALDADTSAPKSADMAASKALPDAVQQANASGVTTAPPASHASGAAQAAAQPQAAAAVPLAGVAVEIVSQVQAGKHHFEIRLDPPELGRIDVKLDVDGDGRVTTRLVVDRAETLDLLRRDASQLERALQQAGLKTSDNALEFSLRQQGFAQNDQPQDGHSARITVSDDDPAPLEALRQGYGRLLGLGGGLDIRV